MEVFGQYPYSQVEIFSPLLLPLVALQRLKSLLLKITCTSDTGHRIFKLNLT